MAVKTEKKYLLVSIEAGSIHYETCTGEKELFEQLDNFSDDRFHRGDFQVFENGEPVTIDRKMAYEIYR